MALSARLRPLVRRPRRRATRRLGRFRTRFLGRSLSGRCSRPDYLSQALGAFGRAIRCHRRLAKLAPRFFDAAVVDREAREAVEQRRWMEIWKPALEKVYGPSPPEEQVALLRHHEPPLPGARTQWAIERELAQLDLWLAAGHRALERFNRHQCHRRPRLAQIARLFRVASTLGRLASGLQDEKPAPPPSEDTHAQALRDLERAYGKGTKQNGAEGTFA